MSTVRKDTMRCVEERSPEFETKKKKKKVVVFGILRNELEKRIPQ